MITSCKKAAQLCTKSQYESLGLIDQWRLRAHIWACKACGGFVKKNNKLTHLCEKADFQRFEQSEKQALKESIAQSQNPKES